MSSIRYACFGDGDGWGAFWDISNYKINAFLRNFGEKILVSLHTSRLLICLDFGQTSLYRMPPLSVTQLVQVNGPTSPTWSQAPLHQVGYYKHPIPIPPDLYPLKLKDVNLQWLWFESRSKQEFGEQYLSWVYSSRCHLCQLCKVGILLIISLLWEYTLFTGVTALVLHGQSAPQQAWPSHWKPPCWTLPTSPPLAPQTSPNSRCLLL